LTGRGRARSAAYNGRVAKPFLKWAGGKARLAPLIVERVRRESLAIARYHEPFLGGGAVFFALREAGLIGDASLADGNADLIAAYQTVRDDVGGVIEELGASPRRYLRRGPSERGLYYYEVRKQHRLRRPDRKTARLIFLNKTCYNGLYRVNSKGYFNVPHGRHKSLKILDPEGLREAARALRDAIIDSIDYEEAAARAQPGVFVYLAPPYQPLSDTSHFTSYTSDGFGVGEQERLRGVFEDLTQRGVPALLSNSDHPNIRTLYKGYAIEEVPMGRNINSKVTGRAPINELLISNLNTLPDRLRCDADEHEGHGRDASTLTDDVEKVPLVVGNA